MRIASLWLAACSVGVGVAFCARQYEVFPDTLVGEWLWLAGWAFLVAGVAAPLSLRSVVRSRRRSIAILLSGHLAAGVSIDLFLNSRVHCVNISTAIEYLLPDELGALILLGPSLAVTLASMVVGRPAWRLT